MSVQKTSSPQIQLCTEAWDQVDVDAFLCPINSEGSFSMYPASYIHQLCGLSLPALLAGHTPVAIGAAFLTKGGKMRARHLIHVPNTTSPGEQMLVEDIARAASAAINLCEIKNFHSIAVPLMGAFDHGIPAEEAARAIHSEFKGHRGERPAQVLLMARSADEIDVFEMAMEGIH